MNPLFSGPHTLMGLKIEVVEPGTAITSEATKQTMTVTENGVLVDRDAAIMYCTKAVYERMKYELSKLSNT